MLKRRGGFFLSSAEALQFHIQDLGSTSLFDVGIIPLFLQQVMGILLDKEDWEHVLATAIAELEKRPKRGSGDGTPSSRGSVRRKFSHASSISALSSAPSDPTPTNSVLSDGSGSASASLQIQDLQAALIESQQVLRHIMSYFVLGLQVFLLHNIPCVRYAPHVPLAHGQVECLEFYYIQFHGGWVLFVVWLFLLRDKQSSD